MKLLLITLFALSTLLSGEKPYEDLLAKNGFVILDETYKQGFEPYIDSREPVFITTDSLLMAFHRLLERQMIELELATLAIDRTLAPALWLNLPKEPLPKFPESQKGLQAARLFCATAYNLLFQAFPEGLSKEETELVKAEVHRVETATGEGPPPWLDSREWPKNFVLPYSSYRPVGPWSESQLFRNYYRYRKWLQETPLATKDPVHVAVIAHLRTSLESSRQKDYQFGFDPPPRPSEHFSTSSTVSIYNYSWDDTDEGSLGLDPFASPDESDDITPEDFISPNLPHLFRFLPSEKSESRELFEKLIANERTAQLGLCIASTFENSFATASISEDDRKSSKFLAPYGYYTNTLKTLASNTDPRLPALFKSEPWARKQTNTVCGSWTEWTYARQLSQKENAMYLGMADQESGYLEPYPEFYREFANLALSFASLQSETRDSNLVEVKKALLIKTVAETLREDQSGSGIMGTFYTDRKRFQEFKELRKTLSSEANQKDSNLPDSETKDGGDSDWIYDMEAQANFADKLFKLYEGWLRNDADAVSKIRLSPLTPDGDHSSRFYQLAILSLKLKDIAELQLDEKPLGASDHNLLTFYGNAIASIMFYEGNSYLEPLDDAPRIVRYATGVDPVSGSLAHHAAIARPRKIIVRYPKPDGTHLDCVGSVYAFRQHTSAQTPTNEEWAETCKSSPWPDWMKPIVIEQ